MATPQDALQQIKGLYNNLTFRQRLIAAGVTAAVLAAFGLMFFFVNRPTFRPLYTDLSPGDASEVVAWLKKENVPYQIYNDGSAIRVPEEKLYDVRLSLAGAGLPKGSGLVSRYLTRPIWGPPTLCSMSIISGPSRVNSRGRSQDSTK